MLVFAPSSNKHFNTMLLTSLSVMAPTLKTKTHGRTSLNSKKVQLSPSDNSIFAINLLPSLGLTRVRTSAFALVFPVVYEKQDKRNDGMFGRLMTAMDRLFFKTRAPCASDTGNVLACTSRHQCLRHLRGRLTIVRHVDDPSVSMNDWVAWNRKFVAKTFARFPTGLYISGDAAYLIM